VHIKTRNQPHPFPILGDVPYYLYLKNQVINLDQPVFICKPDSYKTMPRGARLDAPGTLHHVMFRGIEGSGIVMDDDDRRAFVFRLGKFAEATGTKIYAWALMTNHAHLLLKSSETGLPAFMRKLLTSYAIWYNRRHKRHGHLFQNRYKSIICEEEPYFLKLVSYIHLNPLRAGLVNSLEELNRYPWSGHAVVMNRIKHTWQDRDYVLRYFSGKDSAAQKAYLAFVHEQSGNGKQPELTGGGLIRSAGGWSEVLSLRKRGEKQFSDERILGSGDFVKDILDEADETTKARVPDLSRRDRAIELFVNRCDEAGISSQAVMYGSMRRECSQVRKELAPQFVFDLGMSYADAARILGISASGVNQLVRVRG
jgi:REP element-mobilizing transposase RayT